MNECDFCDFMNKDYNTCTCNSYEKWYACPIENKNPENIKKMEEYVILLKKRRRIKKKEDKEI